MNVILAESVGFCFGVKRAVEMIENLRSKIDKTQAIYTYGPIIHNDTVVNELKDQNVIPLGPKDIYDVKPGPIIIRSHGVSKKVEDELFSLGFEVIDATCSFVKKIHDEVYKHSLNGEFILIFGDRKHAEIQGIVGRLATDKYAVISDVEEAKKFSLNETIPIFIVAQTTFNHILFKECVEIIENNCYDVNTLDTICPATNLRQTEAEQIASKVDAMIVIGGQNSSNSKKLYDICKSKCDNTFFLQTKADLHPTVLQSINTVGITAGASTPDKIIREVLMECQK